MSKRTPGSLTAKRNISKGFGRDNAIVRSDAFYFTLHETTGHTADEQWANAEFIVLAWNAHDDLLAACKRTEWVPMDELAAHRCPTCMNPKKNGHRHDCKMKQAIAKAEGKGAGS